MGLSRQPVPWKALLGALAETCGIAQVYCLKALRAIESGHGIDPAYRSYVPDDPAVKALLTRDISSAMKDPYKAAVEDCLIITMKVHTLCYPERLCMVPWHCTRPHSARLTLLAVLAWSFWHCRATVCQVRVAEL